MINKIKLLKNNNLFSNLKAPELEVIAQNSEYYTYKSGDNIFKEGSQIDGMYIIKDGEVLISKESDGGERIEIAHFINGESFGELDFLGNSPLGATATAECNTILLMFPSNNTSLREVLEKYPDISARILHGLLAMIAGRIRNVNKLISEKSQWVEDLKNQLLVDKLTGLYNRTFLDEEFPKKLAEYVSITTLMMIKPDNFKTINDTYGHEVGDRAIRLIADTVKSGLKNEFVVARYRSNEFAIIMPGLSINDAKDESVLILDAVRNINLKELTGGEDLSITASAGLAEYPLHAEDSKSLIAVCYEKLYEAWENGGNRVLCVDK